MILLGNQWKARLSHSVYICCVLTQRQTWNRSKWPWAWRHLTWITTAAFSKSTKCLALCIAFFTYCCFNFLCLLKPSLGWVQVVKSNPQVFCIAGMASELRSPSQPRWRLGSPHNEAIWSTLSSGTGLSVLLSPQFSNASFHRQFYLVSFVNSFH